MGQHVYKVARLTDEQISEALSALAEEYGPFQISIQACTHGLGGVSFPEQSEKFWTDLLHLKADLIDHFSGQISGVSVYYYRGGHSGQVWEKSPAFDDIAIDVQNGDIQRLKVAARVISLFRPVQIPRHNDKSELLDAQRAIQESTFSRLESQLEKLFEQTLDVRAQLDEATRKKENALEASFQQKLEIAESELTEQRAKLAKEEEALEVRRKALDDSDNTFARRQIRDRMLSDVSARVQNFGVSEATVAARRPVAHGMLALALLLFGFFCWTAQEIMTARGQASSMIIALSEASASSAGSASAPERVVASSAGGVQRQTSGDLAINALAASANERIALWIRLSLVSIGLVGSLIYYIRWQNQWASQFSTTEQSLQQFHIDVNRANWVVETCLEWRKENQADIPASLVDSLTRGLFSGRDSASQVLHPADELASALMGSASKLSLDINGNKVEIDKPGKIPKTISSGPVAQG